MNVEVVKKEPNYLEAKIDADAGFLQLIKEELFQNKSVEFAAVVREHPFMSPKLIVRTKGKKDPVDAVEEAADKVKKDISALKEKLK